MKHHYRYSALCQIDPARQDDEIQVQFRHISIEKAHSTAVLVTDKWTISEGELF